MGTCGLRGPAPAPKGETMKKTVREVSKLCGISVRTLHYYDEIGLLHPSEVTPAGYRLYGREELSRLQQILFFRELDFSLKEIAEIMNDPAFDARKALLNQKELLLLRQRRLGRLISLVDKTLEGETKMSFEEFDMSEIREAQEKYADEVKQRWGGTEAYRESSKKTAEYGAQDWERIEHEANEIYAGFAAHRSESPDAPQVQALVGKWQEHISRNFYRCTDEILAGLAEMYVADERFRNSIDAHAPGLAEFMAAAIRAYVSAKA